MDPEVEIQANQQVEISAPEIQPVPLELSQSESDAVIQPAHYTLGQLLELSESDSDADSAIQPVRLTLGQVLGLLPEATAEIRPAPILSDVEEGITHGNDQRKRGGARAMPFIFVNEICDRFADTGLSFNIIRYFTTNFNMPMLKATNTSNIFFGVLPNFTPILGGLIADSFLGRFWTIIIGSVFYELGLIAIFVTALLPFLRPPPCPSQQNCQQASLGQIFCLYTSLFLISVGKGGIKTSVATFAADQMDMRARRVESTSFFNWYSIAALVTSTVSGISMTFIQEDVGWTWGIGIPAIAWLISIIVFVCGSRLYNKVKVEGSPWKRLVQVAISPFKKRKLKLPDDHSVLYRNTELDAAICANGQISHSNQFRWLDKAAIITEEDEGSLGNPNPWRLNTVHRVEQLKSILRLSPIWILGILNSAATSYIPNFVLEQAVSMDCHLTPTFKIPGGIVRSFNFVPSIFGIIFYDRIVRRFIKNPAGINCLTRIGIGYSIDMISTIIGAITETKRRSVAAEHNLMDKPGATIPISVFLLVPQFLVHGLSYVFTVPGTQQFLYEQSPSNMRSTAVALSSAMNGIGSLLATQIITLLHKNTDWLSNNINNGHLEFYYYLVAGLQCFSLMCFLVSCYYTSRRQ